MKIPRCYQPVTLAENSTITLTEDAAHHIARVLRLNLGDHIILFNGLGGEYRGAISAIRKRQVDVTVNTFCDREVESSLNLHLGQAISQNDHMRMTLQKAVELGVSVITPLFSEHGEKKFSPDHLQKKLIHWHGIIAHACEQSGRNRLPILNPPISAGEWILQKETTLKLVLSPTAENSLHHLLATDYAQGIKILVGAEGGLHHNEIALAEQCGFKTIRLGPRILRTETAGIASLAVLQYIAGDF